MELGVTLYKGNRRLGLRRVFRPVPGLGDANALFPRLTPWAIFCRPVPGLWYLSRRVSAPGGGLAPAEGVTGGNGLQPLPCASLILVTAPKGPGKAPANPGREEGY